jgi:hypothetical protein
MGARAWRQGLPTYVAIAQPGLPGPFEDELEAGGLYVGEAWAAWPFKSLFPAWETAPPVFVNAEQAAALAILAAHKSHVAGNGTYKWMLVGPPETAFFVRNAIELLAGFDHRLQYALSDSFVYGDGAPSQVYPRCLPCHFKVSAAPAG